MKRLASGLALTAAMASGCTSIEQGLPVPEPYTTPCPAIPEALKADNQKDIITRAGSAILACAQENNGEIRVTPNYSGAMVSFASQSGKLTITATSEASPDDPSEFARNTWEVVFTNAQIKAGGPTKYTTVSLHEEVGWHFSDGDRFIWTDPERPIAAITEGAFNYLDRSADPRVIKCTNQVILKTGLDIASLGTDNLDRPMPNVPDKLPRDCDID